MIKEYGYEYDAVLNEKLWEETQGKVTTEKYQGAYCLRSGRDALKAIAREYEPRTVFLTALSCDSMVFPFEKYGHKIHFYRLNKDYSIDLGSLKECKENAIFLYMDYFGRRAISDEELECLRSKGNFVFIEDRTHNYIWDSISSYQPDYVITSLRKWLAIPDGALLWGNINKPFDKDTSFSSTRLKAQGMRHSFLQNGDESLKTTYRKIFSSVSEIMDKDGPSAMSAYSYAIVKETDWEEIRSARSNNAKVLISIMQSCPAISFIQNKTGFSDLYVAFTVQNRDAVQKTLSQEGIFNTIIWPLNNKQRAICDVARNTESHMLAAPCDQRYSVDDMEYIGHEIVRVVNDVNG